MKTTSAAVAAIIDGHNEKLRVLRNASSLPPSVSHLLVEASLADAEFLRLPKPGGRCRVTGLSRTGLIELGSANLIRLIRVRRPGRTRGTVLIERRSLCDFLRSCDAPDKVELEAVANEGESDE
jgi:hypothetical protein